MANQRETVVITGSSGLIGSAVAKRLDGRYHVVGFDQPGAPYPPAQIECVDCDITSDQSVREALRAVRERHGNRIASVIHLAAYYDFSGAPSDKYETITVRGTERLLRELRAFEVGQFVFSSTMLIHAPCNPGEKINEDDPIKPTWPYPESKVWAEKMIHTEHDGIPTVMLRMAGVYNDQCHSIPLANQIQRIYERDFLSHFYPASLNRGQAFVHLDDLADVFLPLIERRDSLPEETVILIGEPETLSYGELQRTFGRLIHMEEWKTYRVPGFMAKIGAWVMEYIPFGGSQFIKPWMIDRAGDHYELDISRARSLLGWEPRISLRQSLPVMVSELQRDPVAWYRKNKLEMPKDLAPRPAPHHA